MQHNLIKLVSTVLLMAILQFSVSAQEVTPPVREIGLRTNGINFDGYNAFSAVYKKQIAPNKYRRYRFIFGDIGLGLTGNGEDYSSRFNLGAGFAIGTERRTKLGAKTTFLRGWEWNMGSNFVSQYNNGTDYAFNLGAGVGYVVGIQHEFGEHFAVNLEAIPGVGISYNKSKGSSFNLNTSASLSNSVALSLMYKFGG